MFLEPHDRGRGPGYWRAESSCCAKEHVTAVPWYCSEKLRETGIHHDRRLVERFSGLGLAFLVGLEKPLRAVEFE